MEINKIYNIDCLVGMNEILYKAKNGWNKAIWYIQDKVKIITGLKKRKSNGKFE